MTSEALLFAIIVRLVLAVAVIANLDLAFDEYRKYRDSRGLRSFVGAITLCFGALALLGSSTAIREAWPEMTTPFRIVTATGVFGFVAGVIFAGYAAWRVRT